MSFLYVYISCSFYTSFQPLIFQRLYFHFISLQIIHPPPPNSLSIQIFSMRSLVGYNFIYFSVWTCSHPTMYTLIFLNTFPWYGFVKKSYIIDSVGQYSVIKSSLSTLSLTKKYLIEMCCEYLEYELRQFTPILSLWFKKINKIVLVHYVFDHSDYLQINHTFGVQLLLGRFYMNCAPSKRNHPPSVYSHDCMYCIWCVNICVQP